MESAEARFRAGNLDYDAYTAEREAIEAEQIEVEQTIADFQTKLRQAGSLA